MPRSDQFLDLENFELASGEQMPLVRQSFITLGSMSPKADNVILMLHGYTSSHRFILGDEYSPAEGGWGELVGPGKPIDTDRYFIVSPNSLGSSYGSSGPASIDSRTNRPYGPSFPDLSFHDIVRAQRALLDHLGVGALHAVIGFSMGGYAAFQWATQYPGSVERLVAALTAPWGSRNPQKSGIGEVLAGDENWNDGWYYETPGALSHTMQTIRVQTLKSYNVDAWLASQGLTAREIEQRLNSMAQHWARGFDPNSLVTLRKTINQFDIREQLDQIDAKVLYALCRTDSSFPPSIAAQTVQRLTQAGKRIQFLEIDSEFGHYACGLDPLKWSEQLAAFLESA